VNASARPPIQLARLLDEPGSFRELIERHAPYFPVQRYLATDAEFRLSSGRGGFNIIAPNFRGDWAYDEPLVDGADALLHHPALVDAAARLFETERVRPQQLYTNITWQLPFAQGGGHTDVPAFRGIDRTEYPVWLLQAMGHSRLFEDVRINIATAVAWFYEGSDGGFEYWPDGPGGASKVHEGEIYNTAIMGDNDRMFHRVRPVGSRDDGLLSGMTLDTRLEHLGGDDWRIAEGGEELACMSWDALRISVSWKAVVFRDAEEERRVDDHSADIDFAEVLARFGRDLRERGIDHAAPADPLRDEAWVDLLAGTYMTEPEIGAAGA
jgi:hypothetical protein